MSSVETINGPIEVSRLGRTLMHEHVFIVNPELLENYYADWWDEDERVRDAAAKLTALKQRGIDTIVDPTVLGLGRNIPRIQRVAELVDITIIVATGLYTYDELPHQFDFRGPGLLVDVPEPLTEMYVGDIRDGIARTGVKAAFLKGAIAAKGLTPGVERNLRAIAAAHRETGAPITVHTDAYTQTGRLVVELFRAEGVNLEKVVLGHCGDSNDLDYLKEMADTGAFWEWTASAWRTSTPLRSGSPQLPHCAPRDTPTGWSSPTTPTVSSTTSPASFSSSSRRGCRTGTTCTSATMSCRPCASTV